LQNEIGNDTRVGTSNEKVFGLLPFSEQMKLATARGKRRREKLFVTFNQAFHVVIAFAA
jgi:hypothetical protein